MLSKKQIQDYQENGYLLVSGIFTKEEMDELENEFDGIVERRLANQAVMEATWAGEWQEKYGETQLMVTHDVQLYSAAWSRFLLNRKLGKVLSDLMGSQNVQLHHTKLFQKPPENGSAFPMHQDYPYFPHENHSMMAGIIHLKDTTEEMGCVCIYPGSHKNGPMECAEHLHLDPNEYPIEGALQCPAKRGDIIFFNYLTIHGSNVNRSDQTRKTVLIQVRDPQDPPIDEAHRSHAQGMMLYGFDPLDGKKIADGSYELDEDVESADSEK